MTRPAPILADGIPQRCVRCGRWLLRYTGGPARVEMTCPGCKRAIVLQLEPVGATIDPDNPKGSKAQPGP